MAVISGGTIIEGAIERGSGSGNSEFAVLVRPTWTQSGRVQETGVGGGNRTYKIKMTAPAACTNLRFWFTNIYNVNFGEFPNTNPITVKFAITKGTDTARYLGWFENGASRTKVITGAQLVGSDPIGIDLEAGEYIFVWVNVSVDTQNYYYPIGFPGVWGTSLATTEGYTGSDVVDSGSVSTADSTAYGPCMVTGVTPSGDQKAVLAIGDSVMAGAGDQGYEPENPGFLVRALAGTIPYIYVPKGAELTTDFQNRTGAIRRQLRIQFASYVTHVVGNYGTNDVGAGTTSAAIIANLTEIVTALNKRGPKVFWCTILPRATSTDGHRSLGNQTVNAGQDAVRVAVNAWIRGSGGGLLQGYFDTADEVESARDSGKWKTPVADLDTGTATAGGASTLTDSAKTWTVNAYKGLMAYITAGTGSGQARQVSSNTATVLTTTAAWSTQPDTDSEYVIYSGYAVDGIHPTKTGHLAMAATISTAVFD